MLNRVSPAVYLKELAKPELRLRVLWHERAAVSIVPGKNLKFVK